MNEGNGFFYLDFKSRKIKNYLIAEKSKNELNNNNINAIYQNKENEVWLGTYGGGIIIYNIKTNAYKKITQSDGLVSNYINCIKKDTNNNIWISTPDGVNYINPKDLEIRQTPLNFQYTDNDYTNNFTIAKNNTFYFSSNNSIHELNPNYFSEKRLTNKILLSSCLIVDKEAFYDIKNNNLELNYDQNFVKFTYSINKQNPIEQLQYAYFLQGIDKKWNYTNQSYCSYNNLPPGNYNFIIKATDKTGNWGTNQSLLKLKINPPFWQTWWFYLLSFIFIVSLIYLFIQFRIHQVKKVVKIQNKMMNMQQKISEDLHDNIGASLSSISMMSEVIKQKSTNNNDSSLTNALDKISEISIEVIAEMKDTIWFINPKKQNFDFLIERIRQFTEPLCAELEIQFYLKYKSNNQLENLSLFEKKNIFLIIKEAINNALKYSKATKISLLISIVNNQLSILIKDDGIGIPENIPLGNGINNMKTRTEEMNGNITWKNQNGTIIEINIPIVNIKN